MATDSKVYNKDELEPPQWLNTEFFTKVLHSCEKDDTIKLKSFKISPASLQGDHFASVMFRANVEYESSKESDPQSISMILKTMPELEGLKKEMLGETEIIPKFESILRSIGDDTVLGVRSCATWLYRVRDRQVNLEEAKSAYLKLAKLHAISYKLNKGNPADFEKYCHSIWHMPNIMENDFITGGIINFIKLLETQHNLIKYKPYFADLKPDLIQKCISTFMEYENQPQDGARYVLCHGDFHTKNMMFKGNEDVMLLDYQTCHIGPIVNDIIYSTFMLMDEKLRKHHYKELIHFYFSNFVETLQRIGYEGRLPKLIEFWEMMLKHKHLEIFLLTTLLPMWYGIRAGNTDPDEMMNSEEMRKKVYRNKDFIDELEELLPNMGYLDN